MTTALDYLESVKVSLDRIKESVNEIVLGHPLDAAFADAKAELLEAISIIKDTKAVL